MTSRLAALALVCAACGPAVSPVASPGAATAGASPASTVVPPPREESARASTVRFDDLGIAFTVPPGYRVLGDEELAARIASTADVRLQRSLRERASQKQGLPLLSLERPNGDANDFLTVSLSVVLVPRDAKASELIALQQAQMSEHLAGFKVEQAPRPAAAKGVVGVDGSELVAQYLVKRGGEARRASSLFRVFVQNGLATLAVAVWPEGAAVREEEGRLLLDGLSFYDAKSAPAGSQPSR